MTANANLLVFHARMGGKRAGPCASTRRHALTRSRQLPLQAEDSQPPPQEIFSDLVRRCEYNQRMKSTSFKATCATGNDWQTIATACLADLGGEPAGANLGLLYVTGSLAPYLSNLLERLRDGTGIQD